MKVVNATRTEIRFLCKRGFEDVNQAVKWESQNAQLWKTYFGG